MSRHASTDYLFTLGIIDQSQAGDCNLLYCKHDDVIGENQLPKNADRHRVKLFQIALKIIATLNHDFIIKIPGDFRYCLGAQS